MEVREAKGTNDLIKVDQLGIYAQSNVDVEALLRNVTAIELGRIVTRDIGGSDPERMAAPNVLTYVSEALKSTVIKVKLFFTKFYSKFLFCLIIFKSGLKYRRTRSVSKKLSIICSRRQSSKW